MRLRQFALTATLLLGSTLAASAAYAGGTVQWQIGLETPVIRLPGHVVLPLPPLPVARVVVTTPNPGWQGGPEYRRWDADGDGIPNRHDRVYNPRWDRDGDGIPNRYDRHPDGARHAPHWQGPAVGRPIDTPYRGRDGARYERDDRDKRDSRDGRDHRPHWREDQHRRRTRCAQHGPAGPQKKNPKHLNAWGLMLAEWTGLEPATPGVTGRYSNQLNYHSMRLVPALASRPDATNLPRNCD